MPPRAKYTSERIVDAALTVTRRSGIDEVSARSVASELGASTAPIFTQFDSMEALHERLVDAIMSLFVDTAYAHEHEDPIVAAGLGWLSFATQEPRLYEAIFLRQHPWHRKWGPIRVRLAAHMADNPRYVGLSKEQRFALVGRASIVMHGLGVELWSGRIQGADPLGLVEQFVSPVVDAALANGWITDPHRPSAD